MKKLFLSLCIIVLCGCSIIDVENTAKYTYTNNTDWDLSITVTIPSTASQREEAFTIEKGQSHTLTFTGKGELIPAPFTYEGYGPNYQVTISNGISEIACMFWDGCDIFDIKAYAKKSSGKGIASYEYVFENSYFDSEKPFLFVCRQKPYFFFKKHV